MIVSPTKIAEAAELLTPDERIALIEQLLEGLDQAAPDVDRAWAEESERRLDAYLDGKVEGHSAADVFAELRKAR